MMNQGKLIDRLTDLMNCICFGYPVEWDILRLCQVHFLCDDGSSVATVAAIGGSMGSKMIEKGYDRGYVAALTAASGLLGVLIPPSIPLIVYGAAVGVSVAELFLATLVPGIIMTVAYMFVHAMSLKKVLSKSNEAGQLELSTKINRELFQRKEQSSKGHSSDFDACYHTWRDLLRVDDTYGSRGCSWCVYAYIILALKLVVPRNSMVFSSRRRRHQGLSWAS